MIRNFEKSDWQSIAAIFSESINEGIYTFHSFCPTFEEWDASHEKKCRLVYEENGKISGFAVLSPVSKRECYGGVKEVSVYVLSEARNKGIGKALLSELMKNAENCGFWSLLSVIWENNIPSRTIHEKCGFRLIGRRENIAKDIFGVWQSTVMYEWRNGIK